MAVLCEARWHFLFRGEAWTNICYLLCFLVLVHMASLGPIAGVALQKTHMIQTPPHYQAVCVLKCSYHSSATFADSLYSLPSPIPHTPYGGAPLYTQTLTS